MGLGAFSAYIPDYPASKESRLRYLVLPYFSYRGKVLRRDDEGTRARLWALEGLRFDMGFSGYFPVRSQDNETRKGMDDLDWLLEIGPRLRWFVAPGPYQGSFFDLQIPYRWASSISLVHQKLRGAVLDPGLVYLQPSTDDNPWFVYSSLSLQWVDSGLGNYFYGVAEHEKTLQRSTYQASRGYLGAFFSFVMGLEIKGWNFFGGLDVRNFQGSSFRQSPLFQKDLTWGAVLGLIWIPFESEAREEL